MREYDPDSFPEPSPPIHEQRWFKSALLTVAAPPERVLAPFPAVTSGPESPLDWLGKDAPGFDRADTSGRVENTLHAALLRDDEEAGFFASHIAKPDIYQP